jgi:hypothetical protein
MKFVRKNFIPELYYFAAREMRENYREGSGSGY